MNLGFEISYSGQRRDESAAGWHTQQRYRKIQALIETSRGYFSSNIENPVAKAALTALMVKVQEVAEKVLSLLDAMLDDGVEELLEGLVDQVAGQIFAEISKVKEGAEPYRFFADRQRAYSKLYLLWNEHRPKELAKSQATWQEQALWIEQELAHQLLDLKPLFSAIRELSHSAGLSPLRNIYMVSEWPSFELAHEQWTLSFQELLTFDLAEVGLRVASRQMRNKPFPCAKGDHLLLMGTQSFLQSYRSRDAELLEALQVVDQKLKLQDNSHNILVHPLLLSGDQKSAFPPQFHYQGFFDINGTKSDRKSYLQFLQGLLEDLLAIPTAKSHPDRIQWQKLWSSFLESLSPQHRLIYNGLKKEMVQEFLEKNRINLEARLLEDQMRSSEVLSLLNVRNREGEIVNSNPRIRQRVELPLITLSRFMGREKELEELQKLAFSQQTRPIVLHGRGGVGKSELALKFASDHKESFSLIQWIGSTDSYPAYLNLAEHLELYVENDNYESLVQKVHKKLEEGLHKPWLLIWDNLTAPCALPKQGGVILVTSQKKNLFAEVEVSVEIQPFTTESALHLLGNPTQSLTLYHTLIEKLEGLPLLLAQAYRFLQSCPVEKYLQLIEQEHPLWEKTGRYPQALSQTYQLTLKEIKKSSPEAYDFLTFCAYLQPDKIHEQLIEDWLISQGLTSASAPYKIRTLLLDWSLFKQEGVWFKMHRLLQEVLKQISKQEEPKLFLMVVDLVYQNLSKYDPLHDSTWRQGLISAPHIDILSSQPLWESCLEAEKQVELFLQMGEFVAQNGEFYRALEYEKRALKLADGALGTEHKITAKCHHNIGGSYFNLGEYKSALASCQNGLEIGTGLFGEQHEETAASFHFLGLIYDVLNSFSKALENSQKALDISVLCWVSSTLKQRIVMQLWAYKAEIIKEGLILSKRR